MPECSDVAVLIRAAARNPRINIDESDSEEPDLIPWNLHKWIIQTIESLPLNRESLEALKTLFDFSDSHRARCIDEAKFFLVLDKWPGFKAPPKFSHAKDETED
jgi:hypothetical protein